MNKKVMVAIINCILVAGVTVFLVVQMVSTRNVLARQEREWHETSTSVELSSETTSEASIDISSDIEMSDEPLPDVDGDNLNNEAEVNGEKDLSESTVDPITTTQVTETRMSIGSEEIMHAIFGVIQAPKPCPPYYKLDPVSNSCRRNI